MRPLLLPLMSVMAVSSGCAYEKQIARLEDRNETLRARIEQLQQELRTKSTTVAHAPPELRTMPSFTVGLAASERHFDAATFERLLNDSLADASQSSDVRVAREEDENQVGKVRGMLIQQYLAADEIPIVITNLAFKLGDPANPFKIANQVVPVEGVTKSRATGSSVNATHPGPITGVMRRDANGGYSIAYEELGAGRGSIQVQPEDVDFRKSQQARAQRQGDISFNWRPNLSQIAVYRVENFKGDVGKFLNNMRYLGIQTAIGQYQTLRDVVFLFGYGSYKTSVVNQIRTPSHITVVEVASVDKATYERLAGRLTEAQLKEIVGARIQWQGCRFVNFANSEKIWERPSAVPFPFVSRQVSEDQRQVFYLKYGSDGVFFIGDYEK